MPNKEESKKHNPTIPKPVEPTKTEKFRDFERVPSTESSMIKKGFNADTPPKKNRK